MNEKGTCGTLRNLRGTLRNLPEGKSLRKPLRKLAEPSALSGAEHRRSAPALAEPGGRASATNSSRKVRTPKASLVGELKVEINVKIKS